MIYYFGEPWARVAEEWEPVPVPLGHACAWCQETFIDGDQGVCSSNMVPFHRDCWLRQMFGGVNHQLGKCFCCGGTEDPDPPGLTRREAAKSAVLMYILRQQDATKN